MTNKEKQVLKEWNIENGHEAEKIARNAFQGLQDLSASYNLPRWCNAQENMEQIVMNNDVDKKHKELAIRYYTHYIKYNAKYDCMIALISEL